MNDASGDRLLVTHEYEDRLYQVPLGSGPIGGVSISGAPLTAPVSIAHGPMGSVFVLSKVTDVPLIADLSTLEARPVLSRGAGPFGVTPTFAIDRRQMRGYLAESREGRILEIDLTSGDRTVFSALAGQIVGMDLTNTTLYAADQVAATVHQYDRATGSRTTLANLSASDIAIDEAGGRLFASAYAFSADIQAIDLLTGALTLISGGNLGQGTPLERPVSITWHPAHSLLYVADQRSAGSDLVIEINPITASRGTAGGGLELTAVAIDHKRGRVIKADPGDRALRSNDFVTYDPGTIAGPLGRGPWGAWAFAETMPYDVIVDRDVAYVLSRDPGMLLLVDLETHERVIIAK